MKVINYIALLLLTSSFTYAQNIKSDVVVIGANAAGIAVMSRGIHEPEPQFHDR